MGTDLNKNTYSSGEMMVAAAAREINDGEVVFVGMRLPLLGFLLAKHTCAPNAMGIYELGIVRDTAAPEPILTMGDLPNIYGAQWLTDTGDVMGLLQQGQVDVSFIGGAQIDRFGNLNTNYILDNDQVKMRLPGSGGACDLASLSRRHIIIMAHQRRRFVPKVDYITSPGFGDGTGWRRKVGLTRGGPSAVITTLGVFHFDPHTCEMVLHTIHPGVSVAMIQANTGWTLNVSAELHQTPPPTTSERNIIRTFDPNGFWIGP